MSGALEKHNGKVSIGGRNIAYLWFADDIDALAEGEQELEALVESLVKICTDIDAVAEGEQELGDLVESLVKTCTRYKKEVRSEKTNLMTNSANGIQTEIKVKGQKLGNVTGFKYLGAFVSDDVSKPEVLSRIAHTTAALTKLKPIRRDNNISFGSKVKPKRPLVIFL